MRRFNLIVGLVLFLFLLTSSVSLAQMGCMKMQSGDMKMKHAGGACGIMQCADKLDLTAEQKDKIKKIHFEAKKEAIKLKAEIELAQLELKYMMMADVPSEKEILKAVDNLGQLKTKMKKAKIQKRFEVRQLLTEEQLGKWKEMKKGHCGMGGGMDCGKMGDKRKIIKRVMMMDDMDEPEVEVEVEKRVVYPKKSQ